MVPLYRLLRSYHRQGHLLFVFLFWLITIAAVAGAVLLLPALLDSLQFSVPPGLVAFAHLLQHWLYWLVFAWIILTIACIVLGGLTMRSLHYRYVALIGSRIGGPVLRWLTTEWRPLPVLMILSLLAAPFLPAQWFPLTLEKNTPTTKQQSPADHKAAPGSSVAAHSLSPTSELPKTVDAPGGPAAEVKTAASHSATATDQADTVRGRVPLSTRLEYILGFDILLLFARLFLDMRGRIVIEPFDDHTGEKPDPRTKAISILLTDHLIRTRDLYHVVDDRTAVLARGVDIPVRDANIRTESVNDLIKDTVSAESKVRFGFLEFSIRPLLQLLGLLAQGRRITGTLYKDGELYILNAQMVGGRHPFSWRIESRTSSSPLLGAESSGAPQGLEQMVEELACRIFTDVALEAAVRWKATYHFNSGLRQYRDCLRTQKDRKLKLKRAEKAFMRTLADDENFDWAYYNLGLVYIGLGLADAASAAFGKAIAQNRDRWEPYYALAQVYFESNEEKNHVFVVGLCERVVYLRPFTAKGFRMLCEAYLQEAVRRVKAGNDCGSLLVRAREYGETAVANSWLHLCSENWRARTSNPEENRLPERLRLTRDCLASLASVYIRLAEQPQSARSRTLTYRRAKDLYTQAAYLCESDTDAHSGMGRVCQREGRYDDAARHYRIALRVDSGRADIWARLWLISEILNRDEEQKPQGLFAALWNRWRNDHLGLLRNKDMHRIAWREFYDRSCDADSRGMSDIRDDFRIAPGGTAQADELPACWDVVKDALERIERVRQRNEVFQAVHMHARSERQAVETLASLWATYGTSQDLWLLGQIAAAVLRLEKSDQADARIVGLWRTKLASLREDGLMETTAQPIHWVNSVIHLLRLEVSSLREVQEKVIRAGNAAVRLEDNKEWSQRAWELAQYALMLGRLLKEARSTPGVDFSAVEVRNCFETAIEQLQKSKLQIQIRQQALHASLADELIAIDRQPDSEHGLALKALEHAEAAVELDPLSAYERSVLGRIYTDFSELQEAESASEDAQLCSPDAPDYLLDEGHAYLKLATECRDYSARSRLLEQAVPFLEQALTLYTSTQVKEKGRAHFTLGHVHRELNNHATAVGHFRVAETLNYVRLTSLYCKARALLRSGQYDAAVRAFDAIVRAVLALYPGLESLFSSATATPVAETADGESAPLHLDKILYELVDRDQETDKERSVGLLICGALIGKAHCYLERDAVPPDYCDFVRPVEQILDAMEAAGPQQRPEDVSEGRQELADCEGCRLLKEEGAPYVDEAIRYFRKAISYHADPETYYHLALAYEAKLLALDGDQNMGERKRLTLVVQTQCGHITSLDLRREYADRVASLVQRISANQSPASSEKKPEKAAALNGAQSTETAA